MHLQVLRGCSDYTMKISRTTWGVGSFVASADCMYAMDDNSGIEMDHTTEYRLMMSLLEECCIESNEGDKYNAFI